MVTTYYNYVSLQIPAAIGTPSHWVQRYSKPPEHRLEIVLGFRCDVPAVVQSQMSHIVVTKPHCVDLDGVEITCEFKAVSAELIVVVTVVRLILQEALSPGGPISPYNKGDLVGPCSPILQSFCNLFVEI